MWGLRKRVEVKMSPGFWLMDSGSTFYQDRNTGVDAVVDSSDFNLE